MAHTYTLVYTAIAQNIATSTLAGLMVSGAPVDVAGTWGYFGLSVASDTPSVVGARGAKRTIVLNSTGAGPVPDGPELTACLVEAFTKEIQDAISAPVVAAPPVFA